MMRLLQIDNRQQELYSSLKSINKFIKIIFLGFFCFNSIVKIDTMATFKINSDEKSLLKTV